MDRGLWAIIRSDYQVGCATDRIADNPFLFSSGFDFFDYFGVQEGRDVSHAV